MSEQIIEELDDLAQPAANGELVHWMDPKPLSVGPAGVTGAALGAFVLGAASAVALLAAAHLLRPAPRMLIERFRRRP